MAGPPPELRLVRHGETEWSRTGRHTGRTDVPLTPAGEREAAALRQRLGDHRFALVLPSPLGRAWETCRLAGHGDVALRTGDRSDRLLTLETASIGVPGQENGAHVLGAWNLPAAAP